MKNYPVFIMGFLRIAQSFCNKKTSSYIKTLDQNIRYGALLEFAAAFFTLPFIFITGFGGDVKSAVIFGLICGAGFTLELLTALEALRHAPIVLCTLCSLGGGIILPSVAGIFFFDEPMTYIQWLGVLLFFVAAFFLAPKEKTEKEKKGSFVWVIAVLVSSFCINGLLGIANKYYAVKVVNGNAALYSFFCYFFAGVIFGIIVLFKSFRKNANPTEPIIKKTYPYGIALGAICATIFYLMTVLSRTIPIVFLNTVPNAMCIAGGLVVGCCFFKEKLTVIKVLGAIIAIVSASLCI